MATIRHRKLKTTLTIIQSNVKLSIPLIQHLTQTHKDLKITLKNILKGLSHEIDLKNFDKNLQNLT
jgi:hypothetical protein